MSWEEAARAKSALEGGRGRGALRGRAPEAMVDDHFSARLLAGGHEVEVWLLEGAPVAEGEGTLAELASLVVEKARSLTRGVVVGVLYTEDGLEARVASPAGGRVLGVAVIGPSSIAGLEALRLYGGVRGEYQVVVAG